MSKIFFNGIGVVVNAKGPGKLHVIAYKSVSSLVNQVGYVETKAEGMSRFIISFAYTYTRFAFYWEGPGEAQYGVANSFVRYPMASSWKNATLVEWGSTSFTSANVQSEVDKAKKGNPIAFIIPDH